ncbi:MAG: hypothetical protein ACE5OW_02945 [Candidatus Bathyarchaeia archaeon]
MKRKHVIAIAVLAIISVAIGSAAAWMNWRWWERGWRKFPFYLTVEFMAPPPPPKESDLPWLLEAHS